MSTSLHGPAPRSALLTLRFAVPAFVGSLAMALVSVFSPLSAQVAVLGALVSALAGLFLAFLEQEAVRESRRQEALERLAVPLSLAPYPDLFEQHAAICRGLTALAARGDPILREVATLKLGSVASEVQALAGGTVVFSGTEAWRTVYERLLEAPDVKEYRSVAWVRSRNYWLDAPGQRSMRANFAAAFRGVLIERVVIVRDELWPQGSALPADEVLSWVQEQNDHGLWLKLVRESALAAEPDLLCDFGVYGDRAAGTQELDERCRTLRFTLSFDPQTVRLARQRWDRLALYAVPLRKLLDEAFPGWG